MLTRFILAVAASSAILVMAAIVGLWVGAISSGQPVLESTVAVFTHLWFFIALFGLPMCVVLSGILGGAMLMTERWISRPLPWYIRYLVPSLLAAALFPLVWYRFWAAPFAPVLWALTGGCGGLLASLGAWKIIGRTHQEVVA